MYRNMNKVNVLLLVIIHTVIWLHLLHRIDWSRSWTLSPNHLKSSHYHALARWTKSLRYTILSLPTTPDVLLTNCARCTGLVVFCRHTLRNSWFKKLFTWLESLQRPVLNFTSKNVHKLFWLKVNYNYFSIASPPVIRTSTSLQKLTLLFRAQQSWWLHRKRRRKMSKKMTTKATHSRKNFRRKRIINFPVQFKPYTLFCYAWDIYLW